MRKFHFVCAFISVFLLMESAANARICVWERDNSGCAVATLSSERDRTTESLWVSVWVRDEKRELFSSWQPLSTHPPFTLVSEAPTLTHVLPRRAHTLYGTHVLLKWVCNEFDRTGVSPSSLLLWLQRQQSKRFFQLSFWRCDSVSRDYFVKSFLNWNNR